MGLPAAGEVRSGESLAAVDQVIRFCCQEVTEAGTFVPRIMFHLACLVVGFMLLMVRIPWPSLKGQGFSAICRASAINNS